MGWTAATLDQCHFGHTCQRHCPLGWARGAHVLDQAGPIGGHRVTKEQCSASSSYPTLKTDPLLNLVFVDETGWHQPGTRLGCLGVSGPW